MDQILLQLYSPFSIELSQKVSYMHQYAKIAVCYVSVSLSNGGQRKRFDLKPHNALSLLTEL